MSSRSPRIVVGLTGGIAAYKVVSVVRELVRRGADVTVVPTESSENFIGRSTLEAISRNPVHGSLFNDVAEVRHVALGHNADAILVAPATAEVLAALAEGHSSTLLLTTVLATRAPVVLAPAMHTEMWENAATRHNVSVLRERGFHFVGPEMGELTGGDSGIGRLAEIEDIVESVWSAATARDMEGQRVLITAGGTRESIDPVRFIGNRSTGHMGVACAQNARDRGATVTLIAAHLDVAPPSGVTVVGVSTTAEMHAAVMANLPTTDVFLAVAAVADFRVANVSTTKIKKDQGVPDLVLVANPDILRDVVAADSGAIVVGFAAETDAEHLLELAVAKARKKGVDLLVANVVGDSIGFGNNPTSTLLIRGDGTIVDSVSGSKLSVASRIFDVVSRQKENTP